MSLYNQMLVDIKNPDVSIDHQWTNLKKKLTSNNFKKPAHCQVSPLKFRPPQKLGQENPEAHHIEYDYTSPANFKEHRVNLRRFKKPKKLSHSKRQASNAEQFQYHGVRYSEKVPGRIMVSSQENLIKLPIDKNINSTISSNADGRTSDRLYIRKRPPKKKKMSNKKMVSKKRMFRGANAKNAAEKKDIFFKKMNVNKGVNRISQKSSKKKQEVVDWSQYNSHFNNEDTQAMMMNYTSATDNRVPLAASDHLKGFLVESMDRRVKNLKKQGAESLFKPSEIEELEESHVVNGISEVTYLD